MEHSNTSFNNSTDTIRSVLLTLALIRRGRLLLIRLACSLAASDVSEKPLATISPYKHQQTRAMH